MYAFHGCIFRTALAMHYAYGIWTNMLDGERCPCRAVGAREASGITRLRFPAARLRWRGPRIAHPFGVAWLHLPRLDSHSREEEMETKTHRLSGRPFEIVCACIPLTEQDMWHSKCDGARTLEGDLQKSEPFCSKSWCPFRARATGEASQQTWGRRLLLALLGAGSLPAATGNCVTRRDVSGA